MLRWSGQNANQKVGPDKMPTTDKSHGQNANLGWHFVRLAFCPHTLTQAYQNKMRVTADLCDQQGIAFIPMAAESLVGGFLFHKVLDIQFCMLRSFATWFTGFKTIGVLGGHLY